MSEIGRQPWIVNGLMKTADRRFSKCNSRYQFFFHLVAFSLVYTLLAIAMVKLFLKVIKEGPFVKQKEDINTTDPFNTGGVTHATE